MAALTITAANVLLVSGTPKDGQTAGEAFSAGASVYLADNGKWLKGQCDGTAVEAGANGNGIALSTSDRDGARVSIATPGCVVALGTGTAGTIYAMGATAGAIVPVADLVTTNKATVIGHGIGSNNFKVGREYDAGSVLP